MLFLHFDMVKHFSLGIQILRKYSHDTIKDKKIYKLLLKKKKESNKIFEIFAWITSKNTKKKNS